MDYQCTIKILENNNSITRNFNLDISPTDTAKQKNFALAYEGITGGTARIVKMRPLTFSQEHIITDMSKIPNLKVMYDTIKNDMFNCSIPYVSISKDRNDIKQFMSLYFNDFKDIDNMVYKKTYT